MDDFEEVFGSGSGGAPTPETTEYGTFISGDAAPSKIPIKAPSHASNVEPKAQNILGRRPPPISPTLPKMEGDLEELQKDPLNLDLIREESDGEDAVTVEEGEVTSVSSASVKAPVKRAAPPSATATPAKPRRRSSVASAVDSPKVSSKPQSAATATAITKKIKTSSQLLTGVLDHMREIHGKEAVHETLEEWKALCETIERQVTIEQAKNTPDRTIQSLFAIVMAWISEHLVDLLLKRLQKTLLSATGIEPALLQVTQVAVWREQARRHWLQALAATPNMSPRSLTYQTPFEEFYTQILKILTK